MADPADITDAERDGVEILQAAYQRWQNMPPVAVAMGRRDAFSLVCGLQLLTRHPSIGAMRDLFEWVGRELQEQISDTPELYAMLESGWNPAADILLAGTDQETHMRNVVGASAPTALCDPSITAGLSPDVDEVTCSPCRERTYQAIADQEEMHRQAATESDD